MQPLSVSCLGWGTPGHGHLPHKDGKHPKEERCSVSIDDHPGLGWIVRKRQRVDTLQDCHLPLSSPPIPSAPPTMSDTSSQLLSPVLQTSPEFSKKSWL
jgi:hypothetical protein